MSKRNILDGIKAIIFDLDGTLIHTPDEVLIKNVNTTLARMCFSPVSKEKALKFYREHDWNKTLQEDFLLAEKGVEKFWEIYIDYIENREDDGTLVYDDVKPCLERLTARELKIGVISSCSPRYLQRQIKKIREDFFDYYADVGHRTSLFPKKPNQAGFLYFLKYVGFNPAQTIAVGNSDLDTSTARNAGVLDILVDRSENSFSVEPSVLIKSLDELE